MNEKGMESRKRKEEQKHLVPTKKGEARHSSAHKKAKRRKGWDKSESKAHRRHHRRDWKGDGARDP